jgi:hypothetical protein
MPLSCMACSTAATMARVTCIASSSARTHTTDPSPKRISPKLKEAARKAAEKDQRTLSSLIEWLLTEHCRKAGTLRG